jgi:ATP-dependent helicase/nuclease subunit B
MIVKPGPRIFTIPPGQPFTKCLARAVLQGHFPNPETPPPTPAQLPKYTLLVPTRRSQRALVDAFLHTGDEVARLLPDIRPIGDVDEEEFFLEHGAPQIPPAISKLDRQLTLIPLIMKWAQARAIPGEGLQIDNITPAQSASLAADLGKLIDAADTEGVDLRGLATLVPEDYENYWQLTLEFLKIITEFLPGILTEKGLIQPSARRNIVINAHSEKLKLNPPDAPIIAAGSTGSIPATATLLSIIAHLPNGAVVLPGLDLDLDDASWEKVGPEHPQYGMKQLLEAIGVGREEVRLLPGLEQPQASAVTVQRLISEALRPWQTTDQWQTRLAKINVNAARQALAGISILTTPTQREEATAIALVMREVIDTPEKTVALVTPDRNLARRVAAQLRRWSLEVDDSAGVPLAKTETAIFITLIIEAAASGFSAVALLALLKHPLCRLGLEPHDIRGLARDLEQAVLRGPRLKSGIVSLQQSLTAQRQRVTKGERAPANVKRFSTNTWDGLQDLLDRLTHAAQPLEDVTSKPSTLAQITRAHVDVCERFAARPEDEGAAILWSSDAGQMLAEIFATLLQAPDPGLSLSPSSYQPMLGVLMQGAVIRPAFGTHARVHIWGPLEARLQQPDVVILGSLNEATWPALPDTGPWLSRPMHVALGLQSPERRIGLSAHDFAQAVAAPRVILTRSEKLGGSPTIPSRWLSRLEAIAQGLGLEDCFECNHPWLDWSQGLDYDHSKPAPVKPPRPRPPVDSRPRSMSVTEIETWIRDPYAIFARRILNLEELDDIEASADASHRGIIVHDAVQRFIEEKISPNDQDAYERLLEIGRECFAKTNIWPSVQTLWWPRYERIAHWFIETEIARQQDVDQHFTEVAGKYVFDQGGQSFTLKARADRIDLIQSGAAAIIYDYKTGNMPTAPQVFTGLSPQLPLEAAIVANGGFEDIATQTVAEIIYIKLSGGEPAGEVRVIKKNGSDIITPDEAAAKAVAGLRHRIEKFALKETPYLSHAAFMFERFPGRYDHLARTKEWQRFGVEDGE